MTPVLIDATTLQNKKNFAHFGTCSNNYEWFLVKKDDIPYSDRQIAHHIAEILIKVYFPGNKDKPGPYIACHNDDMDLALTDGFLVATVGDYCVMTYQVRTSDQRGGDAAEDAKTVAHWLNHKYCGDLGLMTHKEKPKRKKPVKDPAQLTLF